MSIQLETMNQISDWVKVRKAKGITQEEMSKMSGVSRSNIANFERLRVNNMYLFNFYKMMFD